MKTKTTSAYKKAKPGEKTQSNKNIPSGTISGIYNKTKK